MKFFRIQFTDIDQIFETFHWKRSKWATHKEMIQHKLTWGDWEKYGVTWQDLGPFAWEDFDSAHKPISPIPSRGEFRWRNPLPKRLKFNDLEFRLTKDKRDNKAKAFENVCVNPKEKFHHCYKVQAYRYLSKDRLNELILIGPHVGLLAFIVDHYPNPKFDYTFLFSVNLASESAWSKINRAAVTRLYFEAHPFEVRATLPSRIRAGALSVAR